VPACIGLLSVAYALLVPFLPLLAFSYLVPPFVSSLVHSSNVGSFSGFHASAFKILRRGRRGDWFPIDASHPGLPLNPSQYSSSLKGTYVWPSSANWILERLARSAWCLGARATGSDFRSCVGRPVLGVGVVAPRLAAWVMI
jgi:hypothetical protein